MADSVTVYWDGDCLDGYAHGFGREIDVSDYMHQDVITVLDHSTVEDDSVGKIAWIRDYVSSTTSGKVFLNGEAKGYVTKVISSPSFDIVRTEGHFLKMVLLVVLEHQFHIQMKKKIYSLLLFYLPLF